MQWTGLEDRNANVNAGGNLGCSGSQEELEGSEGRGIRRLTERTYELAPEVELLSK